MTSSISSTDETLQAMMAQMMQSLSEADTDGIKGLSQEELSSIDIGDDVRGSAFLKSLYEQFDALDTDGNEQLSTEEISKADFPEEPMESLPDTSTETASKSESILDSFLASFIENFNDDSSDTISDLAESADTDNNKGLSLGELSSLDSGNNSKESKLVNDLITNFDNYDSDRDGLLSETEMQAAVDSDYAITDLNSGARKLGEVFADISSSFAEKLISSYQTGGSSSWSSALSMLG